MDFYQIKYVFVKAWTKLLVRIQQVSFQNIIFIFGKLVHIHLPKGAQRNLLFLYVSHRHDIIAVQTDGTIIIPVQILADNAGAQRKSVHCNEQIQQSCPVIGMDDLLIIECAVELLGKVKGICLPLVKGEAGIIHQFFQFIADLNRALNG